ncbi:hypothetical protein LTR94_035387, partial [Friedmanniomyces endolithicus]
HSGGPRRARRPRHRPDGHRQDGRLHPAHGRPPGLGPRPRPDAARRGAGPHPRTGRSGRRKLRQIRQGHTPELGAADRRRLHGRPGRRPEQGRRRADRHAGPPAGPVRSRQDAADRRRAD